MTSIYRDPHHIVLAALSSKKHDLVRATVVGAQCCSSSTAAELALAVTLLPERYRSRPGDLGEELQPPRRGEVHLPRRPQGQQDRDQDRRREDLRRQGLLGEHDEP